MRVQPLLCALVLVVGAGLLASCGGDRKALLPKQDAASLRSQIQAVQSAVAAKDCSATNEAIRSARASVDDLPKSVDERLVKRLQTGLTTLRDRAQDECDPAQVTTTTVPTTTQETVPETTTDEAPPETTDTTTDPVTPTDPGTTPHPADPGTDGGVTPDPTTTGATPPADGGASPTDPGTDPTLP